MRAFFLIISFYLLLPSFALAAFNEAAAKDYMEDWLESESIMGAQIVLGDADGVIWLHNFGQRNVSDTGRVNNQTQFCIGSCSKPVTSALAMVLVQDGGLDMDENINHWLPEFGSLKTVHGEPSRAPTLRELLSHRGGIYSQKRGMNRRQAKWIRDFTLSLEESVRGIAKEPLIAKPGEEYAYSGAGYCIIGRVLEVAYQQPIDELLQARLGERLGLSNTSFFPDYSAPNLGSGSINGALNRSTPHLHRPFRLPLIGGSLYMTATDASKFLQMVLCGGNTEEGQLLSEESFDQWMARQYPRQPYGLGWRLVRRNGELISASHSGSLASSRASFLVNFETGHYGAVLYILGDSRKSNSAYQAANQFLSQIVNGSSER